VKSPTSRKRILLWDDLDAELRSKAVLKLRRLAQGKVKYDGTMPAICLGGPRSTASPLHAHGRTHRHLGLQPQAAR
jgi:hypothetical protein